MKKPSDISAALRRIATNLENSKNPVVESVSRDIKKVLAGIQFDIPGGDQWDTPSSTKMFHKNISIKFKGGVSLDEIVSGVKKAIEYDDSARAIIDLNKLNTIIQTGAVKLDHLKFDDEFRYITVYGTIEVSLDLADGDEFYSNLDQADGAKILIGDTLPGSGYNRLKFVNSRIFR